MSDSSPPAIHQVDVASLPLLSTQDVVQILQVSASTVDRWAKIGKLRVAQRTLGGKRQFRLADVLALQTALSPPAGGEPAKAGPRPRKSQSGEPR